MSQYSYACVITLTAPWVADPGVIKGKKAFLVGKKSEAGKGNECLVALFLSRVRVCVPQDKCLLEDDKVRGFCFRLTKANLEQASNPNATATGLMFH